MKNYNTIINIKTILFLCLGIIVFNACEDDNEETLEKTRLFRPVLNEDLFAENNTIIANMGNLKEAIGYTLEVSRDTFKTIEYTIKTDTSYVEINEDNVGEALFWNTLYQVRATAHEADAQYDSRISDLGNVRTERFPTILNLPLSYDVIDIAARVSWTTENAGAAVTTMKVFASSDLRLETPLLPETSVTSEEQLAGESFIYGLDPETTYQIAIYSGTDLRGWVDYKTKVQDIDLATAGIIDIRDNESPDAVINALASAPNDAIILVKRGIEYNAPSGGLDKSITIRAAYGFGKQKARLLFSGNFDLIDGANIDHLRFVDLELRGTDWGGKYVMNASKPGTLNEMSFENCYITNFRGICRIKTDGVTLNNYNINNSIVDSINGYGLLAVDKAGSVMNNFKLTNSTVNHTVYFLISKNNSESILIENSTLANINETGRQMFRWRESGQNNVTNGIVIRNSIIGHCWDKNETGTVSIRGIEGLDNTSFDISNTYTVSDFSWTSNEISALPIGNANSPQVDLWVDAENNDFNINDSGFPGKYNAGDPRWRLTL